MDKCREEFEAWIIKSNATGRVPNFIMKNENGEYVDRQTAYLWIGWQASRESMKAIKLPKHSNPLKDKTIMFISDVKILLESTGINVEIDE